MGVSGLWPDAFGTSVERNARPWKTVREQSRKALLCQTPEMTGA